jgi:hypothetical protein
LTVFSTSWKEQKFGAAALKLSNLSSISAEITSVSQHWWHQEYRSALKQAIDNNSGRILVSEQLLNHLTISETLKRYVEQFEKKRRAAILLDVISRHPNTFFAEFIEALQKTNQREVANSIQTFSNRQRKQTVLPMIPAAFTHQTVENSVRPMRGEQQKSQWAPRNYFPLRDVNNSRRDHEPQRQRRQAPQPRGQAEIRKQINGFTMLPPIEDRSYNASK